MTDFGNTIGIQGQSSSTRNQNNLFRRLKRQTEHVYIMSRNRVKYGLYGRVERLALIPGVFDGRNDPEVAVGIPHNPLLGNLVHKQGCRFPSCLDTLSPRQSTPDPRPSFLKPETFFPL